jgi:RNA:NAD 2'-phosphotransferase (TPT1/KptA family)
MSGRGKSKYISLILRHKPEVIGINIDEQAVSSLILQKIRQDKNEIYRNYIQTSV